MKSQSPIKHVFTFLFICLLLCAYGCKKDKKASPPSYVSLMAGNRKWHVQFYSVIYDMGGSSADSSYSDTVLAVNFINDTTIVFAMDTMYYAVSTLNNSVLFQYNYGNTVSYNLYYFYNNDSMSCSNGQLDYDLSLSYTYTTY